MSRARRKREQQQEQTRQAVREARRLQAGDAERLHAILHGADLPLVVDELERRGHVVTRAGDWALGRLSAVTRDPATGQLGAAANPRGAQGYAVGR